MNYEPYQATPLPAPRYVQTDGKKRWADLHDDELYADDCDPHGRGFVTNFDDSKLGTYQVAIKEYEAKFPGEKGTVIIVPEAYDQHSRPLSNMHALCFTTDRAGLDLSEFWRIKDRVDLRIEHMLNMRPFDREIMVQLAMLHMVDRAGWRRDQYLGYKDMVAEALVAFDYFEAGSLDNFTCRRSIWLAPYRPGFSSEHEYLAQVSRIAHAKAVMSEAIEGVLVAQATAKEVLQALTDRK